jgi:hypothetical protein
MRGMTRNTLDPGRTAKQWMKLAFGKMHSDQIPIPIDQKGTTRKRPLVKNEGRTGRMGKARARAARFPASEGQGQQ